MADDPDYSPEYQDEYQRLWHESQGRAAEAKRLLGFALFNHAKGKTEATETLMRKAYKALAGREWDA